VDRRTLLKGGAVGVAGLVGGAVLGREVLADGAGSPAAVATTGGGDVVDFRGPHQAGVATAPPAHAAFAAFDMRNRSPRAVAPLLALWTIVAESVTSGDARPDDTGETKHMGAGNVTVTFGLGPSLFDDACAARSARPDGLVDLPAFAGDRLEPAWNGGDLLVVVRGDTGTHVSHALRQLRNAAADAAAVRWVQHGFLPHATGKTPRNLLGHYDGTANPAPDSDAFARLVWLEPGDGPSWMDGGTFLALRRVRFHLDAWDAAGLTTQEATIGRKRESGAPLSGGEETTPMNLDAVDGNGVPKIPADAHARVANQSGPGMVRRGYSFDNGTVAGAGPDAEPDIGMMFAAFTRDPAIQFVPVQHALSASDALNRFVVYTSAGLWAVPGGTTSGPIAAGLFA